MASIRGNGPVAITTAEGSHLTIPLSALSYDGSAITFMGWPPVGSPIDTDAVKARAKDWVDFLFKEGELQPFTPARPGGAPAFLVAATHPGQLGNAIELKIANVVPANPPDMSTMDIEVTAENDYPTLTLATLAATIGTSTDGGSHPGLMHLASPPPPANMPDAAPAVPFAAAGAVMQADVKGGGGTAFLLQAPGDGGGAGTFEVAVTVPDPAGEQFGLKLAWKKTVAGKTLAEHAALFAYVVNITAPGSGFGIPAVSTCMLQGGADPGAKPVPAAPATAKVPSA